MNKKIETLTCEKCTGTQFANNFYKPLEKYRICKDCLNKEFIFQYSAIFNCDYGATIEWMCKEYNLPFVFELIYYHEDILNIKEKLEYYMNDISLLPMYQESKEIKTKSDIDFINDDIRELKVKISNALQKDDINAHGKWMNSLRDALELREKLQGNKNSFNVTIGEIKADNFQEIVDSIIRYQFPRSNEGIDKDLLCDNAKKYIGVPYMWGGNNPEIGFDCSGFIKYIFEKQGVKLPRTSYEQFEISKKICVKNVQKGDLIFSGDLEHVGIYIGNDEYIHAPYIGEKVKISRIDDKENILVGRI